MKTKSTNRFNKEALLLSLVATSGACGFISPPQIIYYGVVIILSLLFILRGKIKRVNISLLCLLFFAFCSVAINNPPALFQSWERLIIFTVLLLLVSPLIESEALLEFRHKAFKYTLSILTTLSVLSFPCFYLGINFMVLDNSDYLTGVGSFGGLYKHSMVLGPTSAISSIFLFSKCLKLSKNDTLKRKLLLVTLLLCTIGSTLLAASRTAVLGLFIVMGVLYIRTYAVNVMKFIKYTLLASVLILTTVPLWVGMFDRVMIKQEQNISTGEGAFASRGLKWGARLYEIEKSPIIGVGFGSIDLNSGDVYNAENGVIEPGSSWLFVLSSIGLLGFSAFFTFATKRYYMLLRVLNKSVYCATSAGVAFFYALHMVTEGYIFSAGSFSCIIVWLTFGNSTIAIDQSKNKEYK